MTAHKCLEDKTNTSYGYDTNEDGTININSCCGQCYALENVKYCPICGVKLDVSSVLSAEEKAEICEEIGFKQTSYFRLRIKVLEEKHDSGYNVLQVSGITKEHYIANKDIWKDFGKHDVIRIGGITIDIEQYPGSFEICSQKEFVLVFSGEYIEFAEVK